MISRPQQAQLFVERRDSLVQVKNVTSIGISPHPRYFFDLEIADDPELLDLFPRRGKLVMEIHLPSGMRIEYLVRVARAALAPLSVHSIMLLRVHLELLTRPRRLRPFWRGIWSSA